MRLRAQQCRAFDTLTVQLLDRWPNPYTAITAQAPGPPCDHACVSTGDVCHPHRHVHPSGQLPDELRHNCRAAAGAPGRVGLPRRCRAAGRAGQDTCLAVLCVPAGEHGVVLLAHDRCKEALPFAVEQQYPDLRSKHSPSGIVGATASEWCTIPPFGGGVWLMWWNPKWNGPRVTWNGRGGMKE
jgi:hypothetical protein